MPERYLYDEMFQHKKFSSYFFCLVREHIKQLISKSWTFCGSLQKKFYWSCKKKLSCGEYFSHKIITTSDRQTRLAGFRVKLSYFAFQEVSLALTSINDSILLYNSVISCKPHDSDQSDARIFSSRSKFEEKRETA